MSLTTTYEFQQQQNVTLFCVLNYDDGRPAAVTNMLLPPRAIGNLTVRLWVIVSKVFPEIPEPDFHRASLRWSLLPQPLAGHQFTLPDHKCGVSVFLAMCLQFLRSSFRWYSFHLCAKKWPLYLFLNYRQFIVRRVNDEIVHRVLVSRLRLLALVRWWLDYHYFKRPLYASWPFVRLSTFYKQSVNFCEIIWFIVNVWDSWKPDRRPHILEPDILSPGPENRGRFPLEHFPCPDVSPCFSSA